MGKTQNLDLFSGFRVNQSLDVAAEEQERKELLIR